jgi:subtilisin family serine protease
VIVALVAIVLAAELAAGTTTIAASGGSDGSARSSVDTAKGPTGTAAIVTGPAATPDDGGPLAPGHGRAVPDHAYVPNTVLVGYKHGTTVRGKGAARRSVKASSSKPLSPLAKDTEKLKLPAGSSVEDAVRTLERDPNVRFAEPDHIVSVDATSDDPLYQNGSLWGMESGGSSPSNAFGTGARDAWAAGFTGSRDVVVGVVDEGIEIDHPDLAANIWTNPWEIPGNGIDDDGNGYIDDIHGWDFLHGDASVDDGPSVSSHGTHVAGTIGGVGGNGIGVAGVDWAVTMISAKFLEGSGDTSDAVAALDYLTDLKIRHGLDIIATNDSWGGAAFDQALLDAINRGGDAGILFVGAAGNAGANDDVMPFFPSSSACTTRFDTGNARGWDCIVSVAAIDATGALANFSNYGSAAVDIAAPGVGIVSTYPPSTYFTQSGTSMATPHVTGAIALIAACNGHRDAAQLRTHLLADGTTTPSLVGKTVTGRRLNVAAMTVACDSTPPTVALTGPATPTAAATLSYSLAFDEAVSGLGPTDFARTGTATGCAVGTPTGSGQDWSVKVTGCGSGTVVLALKAGSVVDAGGNAGPIAQVTAATVTVDRSGPAVTAPTATARAHVQLVGPSAPYQLRWTGHDNAGVARYELQQSVNGAAYTSLSTTLPSSLANVGMAAGRTYRFRVRGVDTFGNAGSWVSGPTLTTALVQQTSASIHYRGSWATATSSVYSAGSTRYSKAGGASASYTFTGRSVALVSSFISGRGRVKLYIDGAYVTWIDLSTAPAMYRSIAWQRTWAASGKHTFRIVAMDATRPRIDLDAIATLR